MALFLIQAVTIIILPLIEEDVYICSEVGKRIVNVRYLILVTKIKIK